MIALLALFAVTTAPLSTGAVALLPAQGVHLSLNGGDYRPGDKVKIEVAPDDDGYLLVFRVDGDGYVRVLFPLDPDLDTSVRGGRRYAIRGQRDDATFLADDRGGTGLILAVLARQRFSFSGFADADGRRWDYGRLRLQDPSGDAEAQLLDIVDQMTNRGNFDYDVLGYRVWGPGYESSTPVVVAGGGWGDPYLNSCLACGWRSPGWSISIGNRWNDRWYEPWLDPWYDPIWGWRNYQYSGWNGWNGWYGWDPYYGTPYRPITVINVPRRPVVPNPIYGTRARVPQGGVPVPIPLPGGGRRLSEAPPRSSGLTGGELGPVRSRGGSIPPSRGTAPPTGQSNSGRPSTTQSPATQSERARSRRPNVEGVSGTLPIPAPRVVEERRDDRPVYRPPVSSSAERGSQVDRGRSEGSRPVSSPPPRQESARPRESSPPPAPRPTAPPPSTSRSAPPPPPASSGPPRARSRGP